MGNRRKNRRKDDERRRFNLPQINWRRWATTAASLAGIATVCAVVAWTLDQPIESVTVTGRFQRVVPTDVERAVKERARGFGLVSVDLEDVQRSIKAIPWVDTVTVQRAWPHGLAVNVVVVEQVAAACWREKGLLNTRGELFEKDARYVPPELAQLSGPDGKENVVAQRYLAAQGRLVEAGMRLTALRLDARGAWEIELSNGVTVRLGRRLVDERFNTFMSTAMKLVSQRPDDISYVDMRYANGFAIGWRNGKAGSRDADAPRVDEEDRRHA
jgi:cell division protein FtsQ